MEKGERDGREREREWERDGEREGGEEEGKKRREHNKIFLSFEGVLGGARATMLQVLQTITSILDQTPSEQNCNMAVVNFALHKYFDDRLFTGFPLTSHFLRRQQSPKGVYIVHK
eukprot:m.200213 g.200213  ORF g.200213 m.200213 type:complete len:115 (+) comp25938_c0_seq6:1687-2031(+)